MCGNIFVACAVLNSCLQPFSLATFLAVEARFSICRAWSSEGLRAIFRGNQIPFHMTHFILGLCWISCGYSPHYYYYYYYYYYCYSVLFIIRCTCTYQHDRRALGPTHCTVSAGSFTWVMQPRRGVKHPPHIAPRLKEELSYMCLHGRL